MIRPSQPDLFELAEMEAAAGLSHRNATLLAERQLLPEPESGGGTRGKTRLWDIRGLKQFAVLGALYNAGVPLIMAGRLLQSIRDELEPAYGFIPSCIEYLFMRSGASLPSEHAIKTPDEEYWLHSYLVNMPEHYVPGRALDHDFVMVIADREFASIETRKDFLSPRCEQAFRITGWDRAEQARVVGIAEEISKISSNRYSEDERSVIDLYRMAFSNSLGMIVVNISLSIRTALDRIHFLRSNCSE